MPPAMRRPATGWAMGQAAPQPLTFPEAQGPVFPEGNNQPRQALLGEEGVVSGGVCDQGTDEEDGPVPWEGLASPRHLPAGRRAGAPSPPHDTWRVHVSSACKAQKKHPQRGRPWARGTGAVAAGGRESEGGLRAQTAGNRDTRGPGRAKAARVGVSCRRDPCPTPCRGTTCHQDFGR